MKEKVTDYVTILSPMVTEMGLSGNNLIVFALIHGFSKDGKGVFTGSLNYIMRWTNMSRPSVVKTLQYLVELGYIKKIEKIVNKVKFCSYVSNYTKTLAKLRGSKESLPLVKKYNQGVVKNLNGGSKETLPNITKDNTIKDITNKESKEKNSLSRKKFKPTPLGIGGLDNNYPSEKEKSSAKRERKFIPPTLQEVQEYNEELGNKVSAQVFIDYYSARGWKDIADWKALFRVWLKNEKHPKEGRKKICDPELEAFKKSYKEKHKDK